MRTKGISPVIVAIIAVVIAIAGIGCYFALKDRPKAEFEVSSFTLSSTEAKVGESITASATVRNSGGATGTYRVALTIDGVEVDSKEVTLAPGETETITFTITKNVSGTFTIGIGGLTENLKVRTPAQFEVFNLTFSPGEVVEIGHPVVVSATVKNVGDLEGTYTVELKINGETQETKEIWLAGGASETVSFTVTESPLFPATCTIEVNRLYRQLDFIWATYDVDALGIPKFVETDYIELGKIERISKFRSSEGHDYSDDFESCRSMKHYFVPKPNIDWSTVKIFSPVNGTIVGIYEEWAGKQVHIRSEQYPAFYFVIFHVNLTSPLGIGSKVTAGQQLGTHIGSQTNSDIAVHVKTLEGWKLGGWKFVSYFDVMTDSLFESYQARGLSTRDAVIISKEARDADPLTCVGEEFITKGTLESWVYLD